MGSLRDREVACSASDRQGSNFESCVWRTVSSQSSHHPQDVLLAQFSLYLYKGGLKPDSFHFIFLVVLVFYTFLYLHLQCCYCKLVFECDTEYYMPRPLYNTIIYYIDNMFIVIKIILIICTVTPVHMYHYGYKHVVGVLITLWSQCIFVNIVMLYLK